MCGGGSSGWMCGGGRECVWAGRSVRVGEWRAGSIVQWGKNYGTHTHTDS